MSSDFTWKIAGVGSRFAAEKTYWLQKMAGFPGKSIFPPDLTGGLVESGRDGEIPFRLESRVRDRLLSVSGGAEPAIHLMLMAVLAVLLARCSGSGDITIAAPVSRQEDSGAGEFFNTALLLRFAVAPGDSFKILLQRLKLTFAEAVDRQDYPLELLARDLGLEETPGAFPLFDVSLLLENLHDPEYLRRLPHHAAFHFRLEPEALTGRVFYSPSLYSSRAAAAWIHRFALLAEKMLFAPDESLDSLDMLTEEERRRFVLTFNDTECRFSVGETIHRMFREQARKTPVRIAAVDNDGAAVTYMELERRSNELAQELTRRGIGPGAVVGIMLPRSIDALAAILGTLKCGAAYCPLSPRLPGARIRYMIQDSAMACLMTRSAPEPGASDLNDLPLPGTVIYLDKPEPPDTIPNPPTPPDSYTPPPTAYIIYTSGTTGRPKGVAITHAGAANYLAWAVSAYAGENAHFPFFTDIAFDLTITSIFVPLLSGNTVYIYTGDVGDPLINRIVRDDKVGAIKCTPAHLRLLLSDPPPRPSRLKRLILGGENLETSAPRALMELWGGDIEVYNEYGPTETAVGCMIHRFNPETDQGVSVPVGRPIANTAIFLLDKWGNHTPDGVPGEIIISGAGVGAGYLNRPETSHESFIPSPATEAGLTGAYHSRAYRSGDLAVRRPDGLLEFLGRNDQQVKIRGYRIEPEEIRQVLKQYRQNRRSRSILEENPPDMAALRGEARCRRCLLSTRHDGVSFDDQGVCNVCREYDGYRAHVDAWFSNMSELERLLAARRRPDAPYDCLLLFSGGKDSTYVLYRLRDLGLRTLACTFDNGYISHAAFDNIRRTTAALNVDHITISADTTPRVFVASLESNHNVCHGCWHALNTCGALEAAARNIPIVISGLSRGQIFEMRLHPLFQNGVFQPEDIENHLLLFRKNFFAPDHRFSRTLGRGLSPEQAEAICFIDYFRYDNIPVDEARRYLAEKGWIPPTDTGFCSSNCRINDTGIYMFLRERGAHFYEAPLSWDVRLGQMSRETGLEEILSFQPNREETNAILEEIGYYRSGHISDAVVLEQTTTPENAGVTGISGNPGTTGTTGFMGSAGNQVRQLTAFLTASVELNVADLRAYLAGVLPDYMIPALFIQVEEIPLAASGKVDREKLLKSASSHRRLGAASLFAPPSNEMETALADLFKETLKISRVGVHDNFFELGATSFEIVQMNPRINRLLNREIPVLKFFEYPTIARLLAYVATEGVPSESAPAGEAQWEDDLQRGRQRQAQRRKMSQ